jgi:adenylate cyclase
VEPHRGATVPGDLRLALLRPRPWPGPPIREQSNAGVPPEKRIEFRVGVHLGDVVEEADGDLMGDGVNIAARLEGIAKPGAICLSEDAYRQVKGRLDLKVSDLGLTQLKNIAEPVRVYAQDIGKRDEAQSVNPAAPALTKKNFLLTPLVVGIASVCVIAAISLWLFQNLHQSAPADPGHLSIVVLPFANLSGDPNQDYFADGITENLTTDLSRIRKSFVIAPRTALTYRGKSVDAKEVGKELGVRYVVEGSVQRDQNRVRVNAQLIDAASGAHLWAERFEEDVADLFKLQDQMVARLGNTLGFELVRAEANKSARSANPDAIDLTMRGWAMVWQGIQEQSMPEKQAIYYAARPLFEQALAIDPNYADALAGDAFVYMVDYLYSWSPAGTDYEGKIIGQADRAIALAPDDPRAYYPNGPVSTDRERLQPVLASMGNIQSAVRRQGSLATSRYEAPSLHRAKPFTSIIPSIPNGNTSITAQSRARKCSPFITAS